ncbi:MAG: MATE family efflux transporter [Rhodospirillales bacterium]
MPKTGLGVERRAVGRLAGPIVLANLGQPLMGMVDTALSGHLDDPALIGAVSVGALVFSFLFWGFGFLRLSTGGLTAQARGADDSVEIRAILARALLLAGLLASLLLILQVPLEALSLQLIAASDKVTEGAALYFTIRIWAAPASLSLYCLHGWLLGMQDARSVMILTLSLQAFNAGFSLAFVLLLDWGILGIAAGTLLAEYLAVGLGLLLIRRHLRAHPGRLDRTSILDRGKLRGLIGVNGDLMIRTFALLTGMALFTRASAQFGDLPLAANQLLQQLVLLVSYAMDGFADAAEASIGYAKGARDRLRASRMIKACLQLALLVSIGFALAYAALGLEIVALFTKHEEVVVEAARYLPWLIVLPLVSVWCFVIDGVFIGALRTAAIRNAMLASLAIFWLAQALLVPLWANHGLWLAFLILFAARGATLGAGLPALLRDIKPAG